MTQKAVHDPASLSTLRSTLAERLRVRVPEFSDTIFAHIRDMPHPAGDDDLGRGDVEYEAGLHAAVTATIAYSLMGIEHGDEWTGPVPAAVVDQAHRAARVGVSITLRLLRVSVARAALRELIIREAGEIPSETLHKLLRPQELLLNAVMDTVMVEHERELERIAGSAEQQRAEVVRQLLAGMRSDGSELNYDFDAWHIGIIASGTIAGLAAVHDIVARPTHQVLTVPNGQEILWVWLGGDPELTMNVVEGALSSKRARQLSLAIGEPGQGLDGWRLTHRQAQAAFMVSVEKRHSVTRYADVLLLAAIHRNDTHGRSLETIYLSPLASQRDGGAALRKTLSVYFAKDNNVNATANELGINRGTVRNRLRKVEQLLDRPLHACHAELAVALRLQELRDTPSDTIGTMSTPRSPKVDTVGRRTNADPPKWRSHRRIADKMAHCADNGS